MPFLNEILKDLLVLNLNFLSLILYFCEWDISLPHLIVYLQILICIFF